MYCRRVLIAFFTFVFLVSAANAEKLGNARVKGTLYDHDVALTSAKYDNRILELYAGDGWGGNSSLLVFLFDKGKDVAPGKSIRIKPKAHSMQPHLHSRFPAKDGVDTEVLMGDYNMTIRFGKKFKKGYLPATFKLNMFDEDARTELEGIFFLRQSDLKKKKK